MAARAAVAALDLILVAPGIGQSLRVGSRDAFDWSLLGGRWLIGLVGPAIIAWMVWQAAKIRSTQSATGMLYVGVILTFFGELTAQLLAARSNFAM